MVGRAWLFCLGLLLTGCNAGRVFIASPGDYADYRNVRLAETYDERMATAWHYLKHRPDGQYAERLRRYFKRSEDVFYKVRSRTIAGLEAYLRALPDGPHAAEALELLTVLRHERRRAELDERAARETGLRLDAERKNRAAAAELLRWWLTALMEPSLWDAALSAAPGAFLVRYSLALPRPVCERDQPEPGYRYCTKPIEVTYRVKGKRGRTARSIVMELSLVLDPDWRLDTVTLNGPGLILRSEEARRGRLLADDDELLARATERLVADLMLAVVSEDVECTGGIEPGGVSVLECGALRLSLAPGRAGDEDVFWIQTIEPEEPVPPEDAAAADEPPGPEASPPPTQPLVPEPPRPAPTAPAEPAPSAPEAPAAPPTQPAEDDPYGAGD